MKVRAAEAVTLKAQKLYSKPWPFCAFFFALLAEGGAFVKAAGEHENELGRKQPRPPAANQIIGGAR
jgi:hypothetical protein